jgi:dTDP-4-amino-4,6-dideoxygalactose transaminase
VDERIAAVIDSCAFINGPAVKQFSANLADYLGVKHVIPCANGTDALQIALMALGLKAGDEVITVSHTYFATVEVIALLGLRPVFVEVDPKTFTIDVQAMEAAIGPRTKCIVPVHLYGQSVDMEPLLKVAQQYNIPVVEDNAQAIGANYTFSNGKTAKTGTMGDIGCTSFYPSKNLGCYGDGGAMCTNSDQLAAKLRQIANHGQTTRYKTDCVGVNSRLDSIQAAVLDVKLTHLDTYNTARQKAANFYDRAFAAHPLIEIPTRANYSTHVFHQYTITVGVNRNELQARLKTLGIPSVIYYPIPCHLQAAYVEFGYTKGNLPITESLSDKILSLPIHTELSEAQLAYISEMVIAVVNDLAKE